MPPKKEDGNICIVCGKRFYQVNKLKKLVVGIVQMNTEKNKTMKKSNEWDKMPKSEILGTCCGIKGDL